MILRRCPKVHLIATSREPLGIGGETIYRVPSLSLPAPGDAGAAAASADAVALFAARAQAQGVSLALDADTIPLVISVCRRLDGMPLAIELAAARLRSMSLADLAGRLDQRFRLLTGGSRTALERQQTLRAAVDWSYSLLTTAEQALLGRLSVFAAGFDLVTAEAVGGTGAIDALEVAGLLGSLVDKSLVVAEPNGTALRYRLLETIRLFAAERLADAGEEDLVRWRHARVFLARAEAIEPLLFEPKAEEHCDLLELDRPDHDAALGWLLSCGAAGEAQRLAAALYFFWYTRGWFVTGLRWLRAALAAQGQVEPLVRLRAEVGLAQLAFIAGDFLASFAAIESALPAARLLGEDVVLARCLVTAGWFWWFLDPERSAELFEEGLAAADRGGDGWARSSGLAGLGWARCFAGRFDAAVGPLQDAIELTARSGRRQYFAMAVQGRAAVELWRGKLAAAQASAQQALAVSREVGDATWTSAALAIVAEIERARGRLGPAGRHAAEAIEVAGRANSAINVMLATGHLGRVLLARGEPDAARHLDQAVQLARAFGVRPLLAWWLDSLGELAELEGRYDDAASWYQQAADHAAGCGLVADAARARHHRGRLAWARGDGPSAVNGCHEALAGQLQAGDHLGLVETLETLGGLLTGEGRAQRGLPLLAAAATARDALGFPLRPMEAGRVAGWVAAGREQLGEQAQPAWERGTRLTIEQAAVMARRGRGPRRRPAFGWSSLTPAERDVADLAARGLTNPEIAARLGVTAGTIKDHVSSALRKLGVRTRAELAAAASSRPPM
jgi:predicted ATPase/DNA-binding CsgD family transcriptional regulator